MTYHINIPSNLTPSEKLAHAKSIIIARTFNALYNDPNFDDAGLLDDLLVEYRDARHGVPHGPDGKRYGATDAYNAMNMGA